MTSCYYLKEKQDFAPFKIIQRCDGVIDRKGEMTNGRTTVRRSDRRHVIT